MLTVAHRVRPSGRLWNPAADVYRNNDGWIVKVDLAGICSDELEIEATTTVDQRLLDMTWSPLGTVRAPAMLHVKARLT